MRVLSKFISKFRKYAPLFTIVFVFGIPEIICPLLSLTPAEKAAEVVEQATYCAPFQILSANGFPSGPVTLTWAKMSHSKPADGYSYFYQIDMMGVPANPQTPALSLISTLYVTDPTNTVSVALKDAVKNNSAAYYSSYVITIAFGYTVSNFPQDPTNPYTYFDTRCTTSLEIKSASPKAKKNSGKAATAQPTIPQPPAPRQPQAPAPNQPQAPAPVPTQIAQPTAMPPTVVPTLPPAAPTACPAGQNGDPANGVPCMAIPR